MACRPKSITALSRPFPDGQRVVGVLLEYDDAVAGESLEPWMFEVLGRTVTGVYAAAAQPTAQRALPDVARESRLVVVQLSSADDAACTITDLEGVPNNPNRPRMGGNHRGQGGPGGNRGHGGPGGPGGMKRLVLPDGRTWRGPRGINHKRGPIRLEISQVASVPTSAGAELPAWGPEPNTGEVNELSDLFQEGAFEGMPFALYVPAEACAEPGACVEPEPRPGGRATPERVEPVAYPLVVFIEDASCLGDQPKIALEQGIGATVWADPAWQREHPCFVLAPQDNSELPFTNDDYWATEGLDTVSRMIDHVAAAYPVDASRIYLTGQSMGCMSTFELMSRHPGRFAAGLPIAGHWDRGRVAGLWTQNVWFVMTEDDLGAVGMDDVPRLVEQQGGVMDVFELDANQPIRALDREFRDMWSARRAAFSQTRILEGTIWREDQPDRTPGGGHFGTWQLAYQIPALREWLFAQRL